MTCEEFMALKGAGIPTLAVAAAATRHVADCEKCREAVIVNTQECGSDPVRNALAEVMMRIVKADPEVAKDFEDAVLDVPQDFFDRVAK